MNEANYGPEVEEMFCGFHATLLKLCLFVSYCCSDGRPNRPLPLSPLQWGESEEEKLSWKFASYVLNSLNVVASSETVVLILADASAASHLAVC